MAPSPRQMTPQTSHDFLDGYRRRLGEVLGSLDLGPVAEAVDRLYEAWKRGGTVLLAGNGGSAATASHFATDLVHSTRVPGRPPFRAVSLNDNQALLTAIGNDLGYERVFAAQVESLATAGDVVVLISASGNSPNVVEAARLARERGAEVIALVAFSGGTLAELADVTVHVPTEHGEYGPAEDVHMTLDHMISGALRERILAGDGS